ncbi:cytochrome c biogenesis protein CcdA [Halalkalibacterium halodurans]|uniref:cytochrome c biogenesis CcdA family protein n=1 Tax=Halalkalibacterium halodurans TaxID=86665 RepID=UPI00106786E9|nr:cytochrome c biogenesis CcdA family protein [Halalkalibacterium halodurans]TES56384.1 cytochrome c biogenesis protein CcdA [Halalkalibacterium halodurans]
MEVTIWLAFAAGLVSFLSPCVLPLVPAYLAQITGTSVKENQIEADRRLLIYNSIGFISGFTLIFMILGASSTVIGQLFSNNRVLIEQIGGIIIFVFGLQMIGVISLNLLYKEKRLSIGKRKTASFGNSVILGIVFGAGWTPCIGLVLSSILILSSQTETLYTGMLMLFVYSMGLALPFFAVALLWSKSLHKLKKFNRLLPTIQKISGAIMIILGILLFTGQFRILATYFARFVPFNF